MSWLEKCKIFDTFRKIVQRCGQFGLEHVKNGPTLASFRLFSVFLNKKYKFYNK